MPPARRRPDQRAARGHEAGPGRRPDLARDEDVALADFERRLDALPAGWQPLSASGLDGFLCAALLCAPPPEEAEWLPFVLDDSGRRGLPRADWVTPLLDFARQRHAQLRRAMAHRQWFDPWIFEPAEPSDAVRASMRPWLSGFVLAAEVFNAGWWAHPSPECLEPLALLCLHFDAEELEDADALLEEIASIEPPATLQEAAEDLVSSVLRLADAQGLPVQRP
jgi:uncharacterized protein